MLTLPEKVRRKKQPYLAIRARLLQRQISKQARLYYPELRQYMQAQGIAETGHSFLRYNLVSQSSELELEFGYFTDKLHPGGGPMRGGMMPGGTFTSVTWRGDYSGLRDAHAMLTGWGSITGAEWDATHTDAGIQYGCRLAVFKKSMLEGLPPEDWITEIAVLHKSASE
ncbi:hypothetical protein JJB09_20455 [Rhizobium sp. KVB221]|uniref:Uncharacterized protein n=1 Tax=Rhizobium setariae TaxID=2801340 RepID=A0A936YTW5_9HYPH|nr:hypothetical protein [Rhizobium setariae]MBL0374389.1 hypothetical protein [Rhizobium setariae]